MILTIFGVGPKVIDSRTTVASALWPLHITDRSQNNIYLYFNSLSVTRLEHMVLTNIGFLVRFRAGDSLGVATRLCHALCFSFKYSISCSSSHIVLPICIDTEI
jgi:hypothetical protein